MIDRSSPPREAAQKLEERLNDGYALIEKRREAGIDVTKLEDFWIELLREYEGLCTEHGVEGSVDAKWKEAFG